MSVDLKKNHSELQKAWKDVFNDKTDTNWALFGYEGQTNALKVVATGSEGLDELQYDLNSGKIMYAFVKVNDPKTSLDKYVLINWQGDGANTVRKGMCANHLRDIERYFTGAHLILTARNEDEVDPDLILEKLKNVGSEYKFKIKPEPIEPVKPVGTVYQRVNAVKEINAHERDKFWRREEEEERRRVEEEKRKKQEEQVKLEMEIAKREELQAKKREEVEMEASQNIDKTKNMEVKQSKTPEKPVRTSILKQQQQKVVETPQEVTQKAENHLLEPTKPQIETVNNASDDEGEQYSTIKRSPKDMLNKNSATSNCTDNNAAGGIIEQKSDQKSDRFDQQTIQMTEQDFVDEYIYGISKEGLKARAMYDYQAADDTEISFDPGDIITNIEQVDEGWWQGLAPDGITYGLFPANYVELIN